MRKIDMAKQIVKIGYIAQIGQKGETDKQRDREIDRQMDRSIDRQKERQIDRQTDRYGEIASKDRIHRIDRIDRLDRIDRIDKNR